MVSGIRIAVVLFLVVGLGSCAISKPTFPTGTLCATETFSVSDDFQGARRGRCIAIAADTVRLDIRQEDDKVLNKSPWYAFKVNRRNADPVKIVLRYYKARHRYLPKVSTDGQHWSTLDAASVTLRRGGRIAELHIDPQAPTFWVAAQELLIPSLYDAWMQREASRLDLSLDVVGHSRRGLPIKMLDLGPEHSDVLLIVGRQHPPEVSGAFAFLSFAETLFGDTDLALEFRRQFRIVAIPLLNPDGVIGGNWRHNLGSKDLNRDWGPFTQPETQAVSALLDNLDAEGVSIRVFADFHSTKRNLFYSLDTDHPTTPPGFVRAWLGDAGQRIRDYEFTNEEGPLSEQANSKNYMFKRYGIPSVTYEVGDETDRDAARAAARIFAEELMQLMLCQSRQGWESICSGT